MVMVKQGYRMDWTIVTMYNGTVDNNGRIRMYSVAWVHLPHVSL